MKKFVVLIAAAIAWWLSGAATSARRAVGPSTSEAESVISRALESSVTLTYSIRANEQFGRTVLHQLAAMNTALRSHLCIPLLHGAPVSPPPSCPPANGESAIVHVVVLRDGRVWRLFSTHPWALETPVSLGSVMKALVGVPLLARAGAVVDEQWCQQRFASMKNYDGFSGSSSCAATAAHVSARRALAKSDNLAMTWRLQKLTAAVVRADLNHAGVQNIPSGNHPAASIATGVIEISPHEAVEALDALASGEAARAAMSEHGHGRPSRLAVWAAESVADADGRRFVHTLLHAPTEIGGTASYLRAILPPGVEGLLAKTGTPSAKRPRDPAGRPLDTGKILLASFRYQGHRFTLLTAVLAPRPSAPLSPRLSGADFAPLQMVVATHLSDKE